MYQCVLMFMCDMVFFLFLFIQTEDETIANTQAYAYKWEWTRAKEKEVATVGATLHCQIQTFEGQNG